MGAFLCLMYCRGYLAAPDSLKYTIIINELNKRLYINMHDMLVLGPGFSQLRPSFWFAHWGFGPQSCEMTIRRIKLQLRSLTCSMACPGDTEVVESRCSGVIILWCWSHTEMVFHDTIQTAWHWSPASFPLNAMRDRASKSGMHDAPLRNWCGLSEVSADEHWHQKDMFAVQWQSQPKPLNVVSVCFSVRIVYFEPNEWLQFPGMHSSFTKLRQAKGPQEIGPSYTGGQGECPEELLKWYPDCAVAKSTCHCLTDDLRHLRSSALQQSQLQGRGRPKAQPLPATWRMSLRTQQHKNKDIQWHTSTYIL